MPFATAVGAAVAGAAVSGGIGLAGSAMQSGAVSSASKAAQQDQRIAYLVAQEQMRPYREQGALAYDKLNRLLGLSGADAQQGEFNAFRTDPGYQWQVNEGIRALDQGAAAGGMLDSGQQRKAEIAYGSNRADQSFNQYVNRLYQMSTIGQNAAAGTAANAMTTGTSMANTALGEGTAMSNIYGNAAKGIGSAVNDLFNNKSFTNWLGGGSNTGSIYSDYGGATNYASQVAGPTVSNWFGIPNTSAFG